MSVWHIVLLHLMRASVSQCTFGNALRCRVDNDASCQSFPFSIVRVENPFRMLLSCLLSLMTAKMELIFYIHKNSGCKISLTYKVFDLIVLKSAFALCDFRASEQAPLGLLA